MKHDPKALEQVSAFLSAPLEEAMAILEKAVNGGETDADHELEWFGQRLRPNTVFIDESEYAKMCIDALKTVRTIAGTDYGSSRQRDLVQKWADTTRGYLGEIGFQKLLQEKFNITSDLDHEQGSMEDYLPLDIHRIKKEDENWRAPKLKIGIKATKWNGIWLDIAGAQFHHSDIHVLVKVGAGQDHLVAFMKSLSVFKDKILERGRALGHLSAKESEVIYDSLPSFRPIPAYICGFVEKTEHDSPIKYTGKNIHHKTGKMSFEISTWEGRFSPSQKAEVIQREGVTDEVLFKQIRKFSHHDMHLFNTGSLRWSAQDWRGVIQRL